MVSIGVVGSVLTLLSRAQTSTIQTEVESGTVVGASIVTDSSASGSRAVIFAPNVKGILMEFLPGTKNEAIPHGVPPNHDAYTGSNVKRIAPPDDAMTYLNMRGAVYVSQANTHPANTRVEIANCQTYGLLKSSNSWQKIIDLSPSKITGRAWKEDFSVNDGAGQPYTSIRTENDGFKSVITYEGYNFHYFNQASQAPLVYVGSNYSQFVSACSSRLILANPSGTDDRSQASYIIDIGHDWKTADGGCTTNPYGSTLCYAVGTGRFIKVTANWRRVVYSTMNAAALTSGPLPPVSLFTNPDGTVGDT